MRVTLDRYVGRSVLASVAASMVFFVFLTFVLDLLRNLGGYLDAADRQQVSTLGLLWILPWYYLLSSPINLVGVAPFATVIGCMFAVARLMGQNEVQPMLFVGRSTMRILRPALHTGCFVAVLMGVCWQWVVPAGSNQLDSLKTFLAGGEQQYENLVLEQRGAAGFAGLHIDRYLATEQRMEGVRLVREGMAPGDTVGILASGAQWDERLGDWRLEGGRRRTVDIEQPWTNLGVPQWPPAIVVQRGRDRVSCEQMSYTELLETRALRPNRKDVTMALHRHVTYPLATVILLLLALPFAIHFERGSRIERVLGAIGVCAAYLLFDLICQSLGYNNYVHPVTAAWLPTILFGSLGVVMFSGTRT